MNLTEMNKSQLMTELSKAQRIAAKAAHAASAAKDQSGTLNAAAVSAERYEAEVRRALWR